MWGSKNVATLHLRKVANTKYYQLLIESLQNKHSIQGNQQGKAMLDLPHIMASLEIEDQRSKSINEPGCSKDQQLTPPRKLRRKIRPAEPPGPIKKRRCHMKPRKRKASQEMEDVIRSYYLPQNQVVYPKQQTLATIYEEPVLKNGRFVHVGANKLRQINFNGLITKEKLRKRRAKLKKVTKKTYKKRLTMEAFLAKLSGLMSTSVKTAVE